MPEVVRVSSADPDTMETLEIFKNRRGYATYSEALDKLVQRAKEAGLHLADRPTTPAAHAANAT